MFEKKGYFEFDSIDNKFILRMGLIDFLTLYDFQKGIENKLKSSIYQVNSLDVSAVDPTTYQSRFYLFLSTYLWLILLIIAYLFVRLNIYL